MNEKQLLSFIQKESVCKSNLLTDDLLHKNTSSYFLCLSQIISAKDKSTYAIIEEQRKIKLKLKKEGFTEEFLEII